MTARVAVHDDQMRHTQDAPSIGLLLCRSKKELGGALPSGEENEKKLGIGGDK